MKSIRELRQAIISGTPDDVRRLLDSGSSANEFEGEGSALSLALLRAEQPGPEALEIVRLLLSEGANPHEAGLRRSAALADEELSEQLVDTLLAAGTKVDQQAVSGWTGLMVAVVNLDLRLVRRFVRAGARADIPIVADETDGDIPPNTTAQQYALDNLELEPMPEIAALVGSPEPAPASAVGVWRVLGVESADGPLSSAAEVGLEEAQLELRRDGTFCSHDLFEIAGRWEETGDELTLYDEEAGYETLDVERLKSGRLVLELDDESFVLDRV